jgi:cytochrome P450
LPHGTIVGVNAWVLHRNKSIFSQDADVYRSERWLDISTEKKALKKKHLFTVRIVFVQFVFHTNTPCALLISCFFPYIKKFGAGPHTCIGQNIAMIQIHKVAAAFIWRFDIHLAQPDRSWKVMGSWVTKQSDMDMVVSRHT